MHFTFSKARFVDLIYVKYNFIFFKCTVILCCCTCSTRVQFCRCYSRQSRSRTFSSSPYPCHHSSVPIPKVLPFPECLTNGITKHIDFGVWLISPSTVHLRAVGVDVCIHGSFLFVAKQHAVLRLRHSLFNHSLVQGRWACFQFGAFMKKATVHLHVGGLV